MLEEIGEYYKIPKNYIGFKITNIKGKDRGLLKNKNGSMSGAAARTKFLMNIENRNHIEYKKCLVRNTRQHKLARVQRQL